MPISRLPTDAKAEAAGFWGPEAQRRREILRSTLRAFERSVPRDRFHQLAKSNLLRWKAGLNHSRTFPLVSVHSGDWGEVTAALTRLTGECFAVLNMANAHYPGGAYGEGAVAQEENMFRRTDCHFAVRDDQLADDGRRYNREMVNLLSAKDGRVYIDTECPRVCIRGPEDRAKPDLGYPWLDEDAIFPFVELRAAAVDLRDGRAFDPVETRRRIADQLDTLIDHKIRHAVLGAFGCGAFLNPAPAVAALYREEIDRRTAHFTVVAFAIFNAGYGPDNYTPFRIAFEGAA
jgi:hypothetical protein